MGWNLVTDTTRLPKYSLDKIRNMAGQLLLRFGVLPQRTLTQEELYELVVDVSGILPVSCAKYIQPTLSAFAFGFTEAAQRKRAAETIAGNYLRLAQKAVSLDPMQQAEGWCIGEFDGFRARETDARCGGTLQILAGAYTGVTLNLSLSVKHAMSLAIQHGCSYCSQRLRPIGSLSIGGLRGYFFIKSSGWKNDPLMVSHYAVPTRLIAYNRKIIRGRNQPCANRIATSCLICRKGRNDCIFSYHRYTQVSKECENCHRIAWVDSVTGLCRACSQGR